MKQPSLSERIAQHVQSTKTNQSRNNLFTFLALRDEIRQALNDSYTRKEIWETLRKEQKIAFCYGSFNRYVNRLIVGGDKQDKSTSMESSKTLGKPSHRPDEKPQQVTPREKVDTNVIKGFVYDPTKFSKEDLL
jgi:hypothetical protein